MHVWHLQSGYNRTLTTAARLHGLVVRYQSLVFRYRSGGTVGASERWHGRSGSGGGQAFLRHWYEFKPDTFLKTEIDRKPARVGI
ncbi:hypothetical protein QUA27_25600 [Microcoleus sp. Pol14C6]|uniref:hypothetical protein n=1 Tax=unclassified Microcoleus TaxID=2642155 RepID=UPI002FD639AC